MEQDIITPAIVGMYLGMSAQAVRSAMEKGTLPIGIVWGTGKKKTYTILPGRLYEVTGIKLNGYEPPPTIHIDIDPEMLTNMVAKKLEKDMMTAMAKAYEQEKDTAI